MPHVGNSQAEKHDGTRKRTKKKNGENIPTSTEAPTESRRVYVASFGFAFRHATKSLHLFQMKKKRHKKNENNEGFKKTIVDSLLYTDILLPLLPF